MAKLLRTTRAWAFAALLIIAVLPAPALEFGFMGETGNLHFPWTRLTPTPGTGPFPATNWFFGGNAFVGFPIGDEASLRISYELDPVLRNVVTTAVQFERGIARISVGPFFGLFNTADAPFSAGISTSIRFQWPGVAYFSVRSDGALSIGALADALGTEPQARAELAAGFYTRNAIVSAVLRASNFSQVDSGGLTVTDALSSYLVTIDLFKKNIPYNLLAEAGYEVRSKYYESAAATDALGSIIVGITAIVEPSPGWKITGSFKSGVFVLGMDALSGRSPDQSDLFFEAGLGLSFDTDKIAHVAKAKASAAVAAAETPGEALPAGEAAATEVPVAKDRAASDGHWAFGGGAGLSYNFAPLPPGPFAFLAALFNIRGGAFVDGVYRFGNGLAVGGEAGLQYITASLDGGTTSVNIFDLPIRAKASWALGPMMAEAFVGLMTTGTVGSASPFTLALGLDAGGRVRLGAFYVEGSYVLGFGGATSYPRVGTGFVMSLEKLFAGKGAAAPEAGPGPAPAATSP